MSDGQQLTLVVPAVEQRVSNLDEIAAKLNDNITREELLSMIDTITVKTSHLKQKLKSKTKQMITRSINRKGKRGENYTHNLSPTGISSEKRKKVTNKESVLSLR